MKEIIAIIRPQKVTATRDALAALGFPGITVQQVLGRGKQHGISGEISYKVSKEVLDAEKQSQVHFIPKRLVILVVEDDIAESVVESIVTVNQTGQVGDGRVFVAAIDDAIRIRTGESGGRALY